ncbi:MAG: ferrous iron transport protein B, partial [Eubacteriales bacterium]|nr:ferrous iron transport protein B [Eubacteriales bacterium]
LNMMDEILSHGDQLDLRRLSELLNVPVVAISAKKGEGIDDLIDTVYQVSRSDFCPGQGRRGRRRFGRRTRSACGDLNLHCRAHMSQYGSEPAETTRIHDPAVIHPFDAETEQETEAMYRRAAEIHDQVLKHSHQRGALSRSDRIDRVLTHRIWSIPIFLIVMFTVFQITFHENVGGRLTEWLDIFFSETVTSWFTSWLTAAAAPAWIESLLIGGILQGVGGILMFLPQITLLFIFLSVLEDTGYMARAAFITDKIFQRLGLSGRSFIPMMMGFGCTVPAVMAARTLDSERDRRLTIIITPFMSCGARMPIYAFIAGIFFTNQKGLVTFSMYLLGIVIAILSAFVLSRTVLKGEDAPFLIELPPYRIPDGKSLFMHVWDKVKDFLIRAGTIIFAMSIVVWFLQSFSFSLKQVADSASSMFGQIGRIVVPVLKPLGFGSWQAAVALLTGLIAKESVVATLEILFPGGGLESVFTPLSAYAFMVFTLLYMPCMAAFGAIKREMNSWKWTLAAVGYQTGIAWLMSFIIFQAGRLIGLG